MLPAHIGVPRSALLNLCIEIAGGGGLVRMWVLTQEAKGGARESAFLTHFQELLVVPVWGPLGTARP